MKTNGERESVMKSPGLSFPPSRRKFHWGPQILRKGRFLFAARVNGDEREFSKTMLFLACSFSRENFK